MLCMRGWWAGHHACTSEAWPWIVTERDWVPGRYSPRLGAQDEGRRVGGINHESIWRVARVVGITRPRHDDLGSTLPLNEPQCGPILPDHISRKRVEHTAQYHRAA